LPIFFHNAKVIENLWSTIPDEMLRHFEPAFAVLSGYSGHDSFVSEDSAFVLLRKPEFILTGYERKKTDKKCSGGRLSEKAFEKKEDGPRLGERPNSPLSSARCLPRNEILC
jgi:hypothetical protein